MSTATFTAVGRAAVAALGIATGVALAACSSSPSAAPSASASASVSESPSGTAAPGAVQVALAAQPVGSVRVGQTGGRVSAAFDVTGLAPGVAHTVVLESGSCAAPGGGAPEATFPTVTDDGFGRLRTTVQSSQSGMHAMPAGGALVLRAGTGDTAAERQPVACADVMGSQSASAAAPLHLAPGGASRAAGPPQGLAAIAYDAAQRTLTVHVRADGLTPNSHHAGHLYQGSCTDQGAMLVMLPDLPADARGRIRATVRITDVKPLPGSGVYLNIHLGSSAQILAHNTPTPLFQPVLCGTVR